MATIDKSIEIDRAPEEVWEVVGDVGEISAWLPAIAQSSFTDGVRECEMEGGGTLREEIIARDDPGRRYEYRIVEAPMPIEEHWASMAVEAAGNGSRVSWVTGIRPDEIAAGMEPIFEDGLWALKEHLESR